MLKKNEWSVYVHNKEMPENGVFILDVNDNMLDPENWPVWTITLVNDAVVSQCNLYNSAQRVYEIPDMMGWNHLKVAEWMQYEPTNNAHEENRGILWLR